jgi:hypothetical protein
MHYRSLQIGQMMQCVRAENQVEPLRIGKVHEIADLIANVVMRPALASDVNQRLTDIDANNLIKSFCENDGVAAGAASSIECPFSMRWQLRQKPVLHRAWREAREPIVVLSKVIERLRVWPDVHLPTVTLARWAATSNPDKAN